MIMEKDKNSILQYTKKYNVSEIFLFGSSSEKKANTIDIDVKGIESRLFFKFYADIFKRLSKPIDLNISEANYKK